MVTNRQLQFLLYPLLFDFASCFLLIFKEGAASVNNYFSALSDR